MFKIIQDQKQAFIAKKGLDVQRKRERGTRFKRESLGNSRKEESLIM
jgi:hypothetical protein